MGRIAPGRAARAQRPGARTSLNSSLHESSGSSGSRAPSPTGAPSPPRTPAIAWMIASNERGTESCCRSPPPPSSSVIIRSPFASPRPFSTFPGGRCTPARSSASPCRRRRWRPCRSAKLASQCAKSTSLQRPGVPKLARRHSLHTDASRAPVATVFICSAGSAGGPPPVCSSSWTNTNMRPSSSALPRTALRCSSTDSSWCPDGGAVRPLARARAGAPGAASARAAPRSTMVEQSYARRSKKSFDAPSP